MKKLYYSIGEVSRITSTEPHVLRYWETIFPELKPRKNRAGNRTYREKDIATILRIKELIEEKKYSTAGALKVLQKEADAAPERPALPPDLKRDLHEVRLLLSELADSL